jgi:hypothetical protein
MMFSNDGGSVTLVFSVIVPQCPGQWYIGKKYESDLSSTSDLRIHLHSWRGHDITETEVHNGFVTVDNLMHRRADIQIKHCRIPDGIPTSAHIFAIYPPGTLVQENVMPQRHANGISLDFEPSPTSAATGHAA